MAAAPFEVRHADAPLGAEIFGLDLSRDIEDATFCEIEKVFLERGVICIRGQQLTPAQHVAFSRRFGEVEASSNHAYAVLEGHPEVVVISNVIENGRNIGIADAGQLWHTDSSYMQVPTRCSLLYAMEVPHAENGEPLGDTLFASMDAAYDALSAEIKQRVGNLHAVHSFTVQYERRLADARARGEQRPALTSERKAKMPDMQHPVVRTHPATGRKCIYVNGAFVIRIAELPAGDSAELCDYLINFSTQPRFVYTHKWQVGDVLVWDNCATQHFALPNYALPQRRYMLRTTVKGEQPPF